MEGPVIVVTGAGRGIGFEVRRQLAARGARVIAAARRGGPHPHGEALAHPARPALRR